uniref:Uncharacterized protein n=1 Tax=Rhizophora mucronata TaxID=61149 RepID=A0A2P2P2A1_RHIMU
MQSRSTKTASSSGNNSTISSFQLRRAVALSARLSSVERTSVTKPASSSSSSISSFFSFPVCSSRSLLSVIAFFF